MQLTGTPFFVLTVILVPVAIAVALVFWGKVRGPRPVRILSRLVMIMFCQITAVLMVFVMVNNANLIYGNWDDLLGTGDHVRAVPSVPPLDADGGKGGGSGDAAKQPPKVMQKFAGVGDPAVPGDVQKTELKGQVSGVDGEVLVWLPPQYNDPAYKDKKFPVVELIPGYPGSSSTWYGTLKVSEQLKPLMQQGKVSPFILVSPRTLLLQHQDAGCTDIPGKVNADAWITRDVPQMVMDNFRADPSADRWAIAGYSAGAHCAAKISLAHPNRYRAAISMSGYNDPGTESDSLVGKDPKLREANNPVNILKAAQTPPKVSLYISGKKGDGLEDGQALAAAAKDPTKVQVQETNGPHTTELWKTMVPGIFEWLTGIIPPQ
ncbi:esterase family protein [Streptomyces rubellomurinus]|uniref:Esterase n=2 Tax=Streptomyces TaxID=1883 RepID=A0A0F2T7G4_STRR3|nr:alpha/beta hydrolase-fold protein [Streptomyces rubellomurinus]KJS55659.1 esterase [Streptomyces rubellomurinus subsp. indigoferus]KJS58270.1 esterase [Streptomyces rubellomurinus]